MRERAQIAKRSLAVVTASALVLSLFPAAALAAEDQGNDVSAYSQLWGSYYEPVDQTQEALLAHSWVAAPGTAANAGAFRTWFESELASLRLPAHVRIDYGSLDYTAPINGTADDPTGMPGRFSIKIHVYRSLLDAFASRSVVVEGTILPVEAAFPSIGEVPVVKDPSSEETPTPTPEKNPGSTSTTGPGANSDADDADDDGDSKLTPGTKLPHQEPDPDEGDGDDSVPKPDPGPVILPDHPLIPVEIITRKEAVEQTQQTIESLVSEDPTVWNIPVQVLQDIALEDDGQIADSIEAWLQGRFAALDVIPDGFRGEIRDMVIVPPTEREWGSFECSLYLVEEDRGVQEAISVLDGSTHPLSDGGRTTMLYAAAGQPDDVLASDGSVPISISGAIPPRNVKAPTADGDVVGSTGPDEGDGEPVDGDKQEGTHPLANGAARKGSITVINSEEELEGENAPRAVKRPDQLSGEKMSSMSTTTIERGSTIASTTDPMGAVMAGGALLACAACTMVLVSMRRVRRSEDEAEQNV